MDWIWQALFGVEDDDEEKRLTSPTTTDSIHRKNNPPLHPAQQFKNLCQRIAWNDPGIKVLWLWDGPMIRRMLPTLTKSLALNTQITRVHVELGHAPLTLYEQSPDGIIQPLCLEGIRYLSASLECLSFSGTHLGADNLCTLGDVCCMYLTRLGTLDLSRCQLTDADMRAWAMHTSRQPQQENSTTAVGFTELNLERNLLTDGLAIATILNNHLNIETLKLANNRLGDQGMKQMIAELKPDTLKGLQFLDLSYNMVEETNATLRHVLASCPSLVTLRFNLNSPRRPRDGSIIHRLDDTGFVISPKLETLYLNGCHLGDEDAAALARALQQCRACGCDQPILQHLYLSNNDIGEAGVLSLLQGAPQVSRHLHLNCNPVRRGQRILSLLRDCQNQSIIYVNRLDLGLTCLPHRVLHEIEFWIQLNATGARHLWAAKDSAPDSYWTTVMERAAGHPDLLFYILSHEPDVLLLRNR